MRGFAGAALAACLLLTACGRREPPPRLDRLATDEERFLLHRILPAGTPEDEVRAVVPGLGPAVPEGPGGGRRASASLLLFGREVELETVFGNGGLAACGYRYSAAGAGDAEEFAAVLRRVAVIGMGNFHEEVRSGASADTVRCVWSSGGTTLTLERITGDHPRVRAQFTPVRNAVPPAV